MNPLYPQLQHDPLALGKPGKGGHRYEGHSQFLMAVAAEQEGSAKLTLKAAKAERGRCTREPQALSPDSTVMAFAGDLCCPHVPSPEGTTFQNTARWSLL